MQSIKPIRVIHADDHAIFRRGLRNIFEYKSTEDITFIEEAPDGIDLLEKVNRHKPDIVITDIRMPELDGIHACKIIKEKFPDISIIALSAFDREEYLLGMINAGANGFIAKNTDGEEIIEGVRTVSSGIPYYCSTISEQLYGTVEAFTKRKKSVLTFSPQEIRVMQLICKQYTTKEIAVSLRLKSRTIEDYRYHLQEKIGARNMVGIALYAVENGIVRHGQL